MFFHWPRQIAAKQRYTYPVSAIDFYPTFAHLAGATIPSGKILDGINIWEAVTKGVKARDEMVYCLRHRGKFSDVGARSGDWKVLRTGMKPWQLFNVQEDPSEKKDLSEQHPELVRRMVGEVEQWSQDSPATALV